MFFLMFFSEPRPGLFSRQWPQNGGGPKKPSRSMEKRNLFTGRRGPGIKVNTVMDRFPPVPGPLPLRGRAATQKLQGDTTGKGESYFGKRNGTPSPSSKGTVGAF